MQDGKINPAFCFYIADDSLFSCRTLRGVTFRPRKVTKSRRAAARNPWGRAASAFKSLCKAATSYAPSYPQLFVTHGAPARPPE